LALIAYHLRELSEADAERVAEHYFSCAYCSERLEGLSRLEQGIGDLIRGGGLFAMSTAALVQRARAQGVLVREYRTDPGEHVHCTAGPEDDLLVTPDRLPAATGIRRGVRPRGRGATAFASWA